MRRARFFRDCLCRAPQADFSAAAVSRRSFVAGDRENALRLRTA